MTDEGCPACGETIEEFERVGEISYDLHPCGHQVDDLVYADLTTGGDESPVIRQRS